MELNAPQLEAMECLYGPLLVLAGAGSGKTYVVTRRIVHLLNQGIDPSSILGVTFTNKAAQEMKDRVCKMTSHKVLICTFHSLGARILRETIHHLGYRNDFVIYDEQDREKLMKLSMSEIPEAENLDAKYFISRISDAKNRLIMPEDDVESLQYSEQIYQKVYNKYQEKLRECNAVDFDDLLFLPNQLFKLFPAILENYQQRWSFLLIDEYQDTNGAQYQLVRSLVEEHNNLCVVGDPDQSIYSWRGAEVSNILNFAKDYPGAKVVRLEQNYRSYSNILDASNALISHNFSRYEKNLWSERGAGEKLKHYTADTERGEAQFVAEKINYHYEHHQIPLAKMAVFYRTNAQSRALEDRLLLHRIPYVIVGGVSFYQRREIKDILAFLRMVSSDTDFIAFNRTVNIPKRGIGDTTVDNISIAATKEGLSVFKYCTDLVENNPLQIRVRVSSKQKEALKSYINIIYQLREINKLGLLKELVKGAIEHSGYLNYLESDPESFQERKENLNALIAKAKEWEDCAEDPSLESFLEELSLKSSLDEAESVQDRLPLMTIHNGKGLEFDIVFLVGLEEDLFPHANSRDSLDGLEEERRLCYVGMTRAKQLLYLCNVRQRFLWGVTRSQNPSRFLKEIPEKYIEKVRQSYSAKSFESYSLKAIPVAAQEDIHEEPFLDDINQTGNEESADLTIGDKVFHKDFGIGVVRTAYQGSVGLTYKVFFTNDNRERSIVAKLAKLKKL